MPTDRATADYEAEQQKREIAQDGLALAQSLTEDEREHSSDAPIPPACAQCVNWRSQRQLYLADGTISLNSGFCTTRAAADLLQLSQNYAQNSSFFEEEIPF
ncbi:MAG: hypothetical protein AAF810_27995 [Cyanobacteria bacterium P01_D01_bin.36]